MVLSRLWSCFIIFTFSLCSLPIAHGQDAEIQVLQDLAYSDDQEDLRKLDIYSPTSGTNHPVVFWIHGGGWQTGDKADVQVKPQFFTQRQMVFVSINYRLLPKVEMKTIVQDVAQAFRWVHDNIGEFGGDPKQVYVMGHSAGAQLAALLCTDHRYLQAVGVSPEVLKGCVPVDGDTFDIPAIIETAETRRRVHLLPQAKFGHREKFGNDPEKHKDFSTVTHIAKDKGIPPFLVLYVADHPDTSAQAQRLANCLQDAAIPVTSYAAKGTDHSKLNEDLGNDTDGATGALVEFLDKTLKPESN